MKAIQKRGSRYTATVRLNGHSLSCTFPKKLQAKEWVTRVDMAIRDEVANPNRIFRREDFLPKRVERPKSAKQEANEAREARATPSMEWTLGQAISHYENTELDKLKGFDQAFNRLKAWRKSELSAKLLTDITPDDLVDWMESRRKVVNGKSVKVSPSTIRNDIFRVSAIYELAMKPRTKGGWGLTELKNPVRDILLPPVKGGRQRRLHRGEEEQMMEALGCGLDGREMIAIVTLAIETGMRRSEILSIKRCEIHETDRGMSIVKGDTKNDHPRTIYLSRRAEEAIKPMMEGKAPERLVFTLIGDAVATRWDIARKKIGKPDLRLHDLRHEAISRLADRGLSVGALSAMSGHRTMQTLLRYVNVSEMDIRAKLEAG